VQRGAHSREKGNHIKWGNWPKQLANALVSWVCRRVDREYTQQRTSKMGKSSSRDACSADEGWRRRVARPPRPAPRLSGGTDVSCEGSGSLWGGRDGGQIFDEFHCHSPNSDKLGPQGGSPFAGRSAALPVTLTVGARAAPATQRCSDPKRLFDGIHRNEASVHAALNHPRQLEECLRPTHLLPSEIANRLDPDGDRRPLHWASARGHASCVRLLLQAGADPEAVDANGRTAMALGLEHEECAALLISWASGSRE